MKEHLEILEEQVANGEVDKDMQNVGLIRLERARLIKNSIPRSVRNELLRGVKKGLLARLPKDGYKPECFYHPDFEHLAIGKRAQAKDKVTNALRKMAGFTKN